MANTLAYYNTATVTSVKCLKSTGPGVPNHKCNHGFFPLFSIFSALFKNL